MAKNIENKALQLCGGGVNTSSRATFGLKTQDVIASVSEAIQRLFTQLSHKPQCHSELGSESHVDKIPCQARDDKRGILPLCKALAFTLAETLIVMGIIGVVAALTIPNLNSSTADKEKVAKVKKLYSNLQDAFGRAQAVYGPYDEWFTGITNYKDINTRFGERMTEFMKVSKNCKLSTGCASKSKAYYYDGSEMEPNLDDSHINYYNVILADGTSLSFERSVIHVDIDGPNKGKTKEGSDLFTFRILDDENNNCAIEYFPSSGGSTGNLYYMDLLGWVILNNNMDYLKATLTGDTYKCPNGKILNWETQTSCK